MNQDRRTALALFLVKAGLAFAGSLIILACLAALSIIFNWH